MSGRAPYTGAAHLTEHPIKRTSWLDVIASTIPGEHTLTAATRDTLAHLDDVLFDLWDLGQNLILVWMRDGPRLSFLATRHYAIAQNLEASAAGGTRDVINTVLAGDKHVAPAQFAAIRAAFGRSARVVDTTVAGAPDIDVDLVSALVTRYGVSLVRERAVVLLDAVGFSLGSPLEQVAMLNSLAYSVNSAHSQLMSRDVHINFARTTTGDGFYIWNRSRTVAGSIALYKLMMLVLADNAVAQRKARGAPVPRLRAAFHVGEQYEFYQVEALNPTTFGYIVGQVTIELSRMIDKALPGQILLGDFSMGRAGGASGTLGFVERTAATLDQLQGLAVAGDRIDQILCYLTGENLDDAGFAVTEYEISDKHGLTRRVYNAKINIHLQSAAPIFLGLQHRELHPPGAHDAWPRGES